MSTLNIITAEQMRTHGLPPLEISWRGHHRIIQFPEPSMPLFYHGPPGGPDKLYLKVLERSPEFSVDDEVRLHDQPGHHFHFGELGEFEIGGKKLTVRLWSVKPTPWLDSQATTYVEIPEVNAIVLITFSAGRDDGGRIVTRPAQQEILASLTIIPKPY